MCGKSVHPIFDHKNLVVLGLYKVILVTACLKAEEVKRNFSIGCDTANEPAWHRENVFIEVFLRDLFLKYHFSHLSPSEIFQSIHFLNVLIKPVHLPYHNLLGN